MRLLLITVLTFCFAYAKHEMYDGHTLLKIKVNDIEQMNFINSLEIPLGLDMFIYPSLGKDASVLVSKEQKQKLLNELLDNNFDFEIETENIKQSLDLEEKLIEEAKRKNSRKSGFQGKIGFDRVYNYTEVVLQCTLRLISFAKEIKYVVDYKKYIVTIEMTVAYSVLKVDAYLDAIAESYPDVVTLVNAGKSFEGRDIKYLKISSTNFEDTSKPIVFIESLIHAREWITLPPTLWAIEQLVVNVTESDLIDTMDWIILPIANPDGYEQTHMGNRFWRKNRATGFFPSSCIGVDLNRNFDILFGQHSDTFACSDGFHGSFPNSEPETKVISKIMDEHKDRIDLFIDIHSTGNYIFYGWGNGQLLPNVFSLQQIGLNMGQAMDAVKLEWNRNYIVGNSALILYPASGLAMDYANKVGIPYSYVYELPAHRNSFGLNGFLVDPELVEHFAMETWEGIKIGARNVRDILA